MSLRNVAENVCLGNILLQNSQRGQREMENMIRSLDYYEPKKKRKKKKTKKIVTLFIARKLYKGRKTIIMAFQTDIFLLPCQYPAFHYYHFRIKNGQRKKDKKVLYLNLTK